MPIKFRAKYSGKIYNTKQEAADDNKRYLSDVDYRYGVKSNNTKHPTDSKIPFINSKRRTLSNAGLATGAVISENLLDSIGKYADLAGLPIKTALGLAVKESTLGNPTDDKSVYKILNSERKKFFMNSGTGQHINPGVAIHGRSLVNFYKDEDDPYIEAKAYALRKANYDEPSIYDENVYKTLLTNGENYADKKVKDYEERYGNNNVLFNAFSFYKDNPDKYNPGQSNYQQLVNKRADEVWNSPEIQNWYKNYRRRLESRGSKSK